MAQNKSDNALMMYDIILDLQNLLLENKADNKILREKVIETLNSIIMFENPTEYSASTYTTFFNLLRLYYKNDFLINTLLEKISYDSVVLDLILSQSNCDNPLIEDNITEKNALSESEKAYFTIENGQKKLKDEINMEGNHIFGFVEKNGENSVHKYYTIDLNTGYVVDEESRAMESEFETIPFNNTYSKELLKDEFDKIRHKLFDRDNTFEYDLEEKIEEEDLWY